MEQQNYAREKLTNHVAEILNDQKSREIVSSWGYSVIYEIHAYRIFLHSESRETPGHVKVVFTPRYRSTDRYKRGLKFSPPQIQESLASALPVEILEFYVINYQIESFWIIIKDINHETLWSKIK